MKRIRRQRPVHPFDHGEPLGRIDLGPLAGVLLVAAAVLVLAWPVPINTITIPLISPGLDQSVRTAHRITVTQLNQILWDGTPVNLTELVEALRDTLQEPGQPELELRADANTSYELVAAVTTIIGGSGLLDDRFHFVDLERHGDLLCSGREPQPVAACDPPAGDHSDLIQMIM